MLLYTMLAYLMLFTALFNAVCLYNACFLLLNFALLFLQMSFAFMLCVLVIDTLLFSIVVFRNAQCF